LNVCTDPFENVTVSVSPASVNFVSRSAGFAATDGRPVTNSIDQPTWYVSVSPLTSYVPAWARPQRCPPSSIV
jgi:hypothetical protein